MHAYFVVHSKNQEGQVNKCLNIQSFLITLYIPWDVDGTGDSWDVDGIGDTWEVDGADDFSMALYNLGIANFDNRTL